MITIWRENIFLLVAGENTDTYLIPNVIYILRSKRQENEKQQ